MLYFCSFCLLCCFFRICGMLPHGVKFAMFRKSVCWGSCFHQELSPLSENISFIIEVFVLNSSPRERFLLSLAIFFWYPNTSHFFIMPKILIRSSLRLFLLWSGFMIIFSNSPLGNPVDTAFSGNFVESGKRLFNRSVTKKEPVSPDTIYRICPTFAHSTSNLKDLRTALLFAIFRCIST